MLSDQDRIFTNLYGLQDWRLEAARKRGAWNATADMITAGRDWVITQTKNSGLRGRADALTLDGRPIAVSLALVTGGNTGIGQGIATRLASDGADGGGAGRIGRKTPLRPGDGLLAMATKRQGGTVHEKRDRRA